MAQWNVKNIVDQSGKVTIVTGANSGIGFDTAKALAAKGATTILACRSKSKADNAGGSILAEYPEAKVVIMELDLSDLTSVKKFSDDFVAEFERLDYLINNAGVMVPPYSKTKDGFELQFGTNHLGHFALTGHLLPLLLKTPKSRIVTVSSVAHKSGKISFDDYNWEKRRYIKWSAYGQSKVANLFFTYELQRKLEVAGVETIAVAAHPGWTATNLQQHTTTASFLNRFFAQPQEMGALPTLYAAASPEVKGGEYFGPCGFMEMRGFPKKVGSNKYSHDREVASRLWDLSEKLTGVTYSFE